MATATTVPLNAATGSTDYQNLLTEIKNTIDKNDRLFQQIQKVNYPNAGNYASDLLNYKIDTQVSDLTQARKTIWDFVNRKYQENTKLRSFYFDEIRKADKHISDLTKQQQEFIDLIRMLGDEIELNIYGGLLRHILETGASSADIKEI